MINAPLDQVKREIIGSLASVLKDLKIPYEKENLKETITEPPDPKLGDLSTTTSFQLAKKLKKNPVEIANLIAKNLKPKGLIKELKQVGPYVNFFLDPEKFGELVVSQVLKEKVKYGSGPSKKEKVIVEHTSANPNKPIHMGTARCAILGDVMAKVLKFAGYQVEIQNYIDDLGRQSAVAVYGYEKFYDTLTEQEKKTKDDFWLGLLYSKAAQYIKDNPKEEVVIQKLIKELEEGRGKSKLKDELVGKSLRAQLETCFRLNIFYDLLVWEKDIVRSKLFEEALKRMLKSEKVYKIKEGEDKGCIVIDMSEYKKFGDTFKPYKVLVRSDRTATYAGKDIAYHLWKFGLSKANLKFKEYLTQPNGNPLYTTAAEGKKLKFGHADKVINVIGYEQKFPQQVVYHGVKILGHQKAFENSYHLSFKWVWLPGQEKFAGRTGSWVGYHTDAVLDKAHPIVYQRVKENNLDLSEEKINRIAEQIAIGAVRFYITKSDLEKKIVFKYEDALSLEGETGPYIQYAGVRAKKILEKSNTKVEGCPVIIKSLEERELIKQIAKFPEVVKTVSEGYTPNSMARYAYQLALKFSNFYEQCPVLKAESELKKSRLALVKATQITLENSLNLLGIHVPELM